MYVADLHKQEAMEVCARRIEEHEQRACQLKAGRVNGCSTKVMYDDTHLVFYPMFSLTYTHKGKSYHNFIDGINGKVLGDIPENKIIKYLLKSVKGILTLIGILTIVWFFYLMIFY